MQQYRKNLGKVSLTTEGAWNRNKNYEILSIVYEEHTNHGFISRKNVPEGVDITNKEYWMPFNVSGYADNNIIILSKKISESAIESYTLEEAVKSIATVGRRPGTILGFYNENSDRMDIGGCWELWQYNGVDVADWENLNSWNSIYYNYNKFVGWYRNEDILKKYVPFPEIGCYAYVGSNLNDAVIYRCDRKYAWTNTTEHVWNYFKVIVDGNVTIGENGNWFNNGVDTNIPASVKGENGKTPIIRNNNNVLEVSYDNVNWETISDEVAVWARVNNNKLEITKHKVGGWEVVSDYIAAWFRWQSQGGQQAFSTGKIQITRDGITWTDLSGEFVNNLRISRYIGADETLPTSGVAEGTIYAKGPYYEDDDTLNEYPAYRIWVYAWKGNTLAWIDHGQFTSIAAGIVQETGDSEVAVMSQKAVTEKLSELGSKLNGVDLASSTAEVNADSNKYTFTRVIYPQTTGTKTYYISFSGIDIKELRVQSNDRQDLVDVFPINNECIVTISEGGFYWRVDFDTISEAINLTITVKEAGINDYLKFFNNAHYRFGGVVSLISETPLCNKFFLVPSGTTMSVPAISVPVGSFGIISYDIVTETWGTYTIKIYEGIDNIPTKDSNNFVKSSGLYKLYKEVLGEELGSVSGEVASDANYIAFNRIMPVPDSAQKCLFELSNKPTRLRIDDAAHHILVDIVPKSTFILLTVPANAFYYTFYFSNEHETFTFNVSISAPSLYDSVYYTIANELSVDKENEIDVSKLLSTYNGVSSLQIQNGTSKYNEVLENYTSHKVTIETAGVFFNLLKAGYSMQTVFSRQNFWNPMVNNIDNNGLWTLDADNNIVPAALEDINLNDYCNFTYSGQNLLLNCIDLTRTIDNIFDGDYVAKCRASIIALIRKAYKEYKAIPSLSWHLGNPYTPHAFGEYGGTGGGMQDMFSVYHSNKTITFPDETTFPYPSSHVNVVEEILNSTVVSEDGLTPLVDPDGYWLPNESTRCGRGKFGSADTQGYTSPREWFDAKCQAIAEVINELVDENGTPIPCILRLWHECESSSFWWGSGYRNYCSNEQYIQFYRLTVNTIQSHLNENNVLYGYCMTSYWGNASEFLARYAGDDYVDVIGFDNYAIGLNDASNEGTLNQCKVVTEIARQKIKIGAIFETGNYDEVQKSQNMLNDVIYPILRNNDVGLGIFQIWSSFVIDRDSQRNDFTKFVRRFDIVTDKNNIHLPTIEQS